MAKTVRGLEGLDKVLKALPKEVAKHVMLGATLKGSSIVRKKIQQNSPIRTGLLKKSFVIAAPAIKRQDRVIDRIRITNQFWRPELVEGGVQRSFTAKRGKMKGKVVSFRAKSKELPPSGYGWILEKDYKKKLTAKDARKRLRKQRALGRVWKGYIRSAYESTASQVVDVIATELRDGIVSQATLLGRRARIA